MTTLDTPTFFMWPGDVTEFAWGWANAIYAWNQRNGWPKRQSPTRDGESDA